VQLTKLGRTTEQPGAVEVVVQAARVGSTVEHPSVVGAAMQASRDGVAVFVVVPVLSVVVIAPFGALADPPVPIITLSLAFRVMPPVVDATGPFRVRMSPPVVDGEAISVMSPVAVTPPLPIVIGLWAVIFKEPAEVIGSAPVIVAPVLLIMTLPVPVSVIASMLNGNDVFMSSMLPLVVLVALKFAIWLLLLFSVVPVAVFVFRVVVAIGPVWVILPVVAVRLTADAIRPFMLMSPVLWVSVAAPVSLMLPPVWVKRFVAVIVPAVIAPPVWFKPVVFSALFTLSEPLAITMVWLLLMFWSVVLPVSYVT